MSSDAELTRDMQLLDREFRAVIERHFHLRLGHDLASISRLDALFAQSRLREIAQADERNVSVMLAAYLGETIRALSRGGRWELDEALGPCIVDVPRVPGSMRVLSRAQKRIQSAEELLVPFISAAIALKN
jgi:hypothetical protein